VVNRISLMTGKNYSNFNQSSKLPRLFDAAIGQVNLSDWLKLLWFQHLKSISGTYALYIRSVCISSNHKKFLHSKRNKYEACFLSLN